MENKRKKGTENMFMLETKHRDIIPKLCLEVISLNISLEL